MNDFTIYSEYSQDSRYAQVVKSNTTQAWGVYLLDKESKNNGFLMWHPTKSECWCEDIAENFCQGMVKEDGSVRDNMYYVRGLHKA